MASPIQPGDVFIRRAPSHDYVRIMLPPRPKSGKQHYLLLNFGSIGAAWWRTHEEVEATPRGLTNKKYCYVGTVPEWFLHELLNETDW